MHKRHIVVQKYKKGKEKKKTIQKTRYKKEES